MERSTWAGLDCAWGLRCGSRVGTPNRTRAVGVALRAGALAVCMLSWMWVGRAHAAAAVPPEVRYKTTLPAVQGHRFTLAETLAFLNAARVAEAIVDPLQRCLAYPDPPGSHWNHAAVVAYCHYRTQPIVTFAEVRALVESGHAAKLDKLLAQALHAQQTDPAAAGLVDRIYQTDFRHGSYAIRPILDAWKRQSPDSAFAYAASGMAYTRMAFKARGSDWMTKTKQYQVDSMERLAREANADLLHALKLNPKLTPAYTAMVSLGGMAFSTKYAAKAAELGLTVAPDDESLYVQVLWLLEPKWDGSMQLMTTAVDRALQHEVQNPLLDLLTETVALYRVDNCGCSDAKQSDAFSAIAEHLVGYRKLEDMADTADGAHDVDAAAIFYSEALRFDAEWDPPVVGRMYELIKLHHAEWAVQDGDRVLARSPDNEYAHKARGWAYLTLGDAAKAQDDLERSVALDPTDTWALWRLGDAYWLGRRWDKAWGIADELVKRDPTNDEGWLLRLRVQACEPRPGLAQTVDYIVAHFADDPLARRLGAFGKSVLQARAAYPGKTNAEVLQLVAAQRRQHPAAGVPASSASRN